VLIWLWVIAAIVVIVMLVLCFGYIQGQIHFVRLEKQDHLDLHVQAAVGIKIIRFLPVFKMKSFSKQIPIHLKKSQPVPAEQHTNQTKPKPKGKMKAKYHMVQLLRHNTTHLYAWLKNLLARIECTQLKWITRVGIGDAPQTAIAAGAVWGMKSSLLGYMMHLVQVRSKPLVEVVPQYNHAQFSTDLTSVAGIRPIFIIWAGIELLWRIMKIKGGLRTWYRVIARPKMST
jgi:hypothetical protein